MNLNAIETAEALENIAFVTDPKIVCRYAATMLRQQQAELDTARQVIQSIANEQVELSHDKIKWQNGDHIRWCKKFIEEYNK